MPQCVQSGSVYHGWAGMATATQLWAHGYKHTVQLRASLAPRAPKWAHANTWGLFALAPTLATRVGHRAQAPCGPMHPSGKAPRQGPWPPWPPFVCLGGQGQPRPANGLGCPWPPKHTCAPKPGLVLSRSQDGTWCAGMAAQGPKWAPTSGHVSAWAHVCACDFTFSR